MLPRFRLVRTFDLAPPSGRVALGGRFPGLKPWAEFCSPCGAENKEPRIVVAYCVFSLSIFWKEIREGGLIRGSSINMTEGLPRRGYSTQPRVSTQVSTLGTRIINDSP